MTVTTRNKYVSPWEVIASLGGVKELKQVAKNAGEELFFRRFGREVTEAYHAGPVEGRWDSQATMATCLDVSESCIKRLMAARKKPGYIRGMKYGDMIRVARGLNIREGALWPNDAETEAGAMRGIVSVMRQSRRDMRERLSGGEFDDRQLEAVSQLTETIDRGGLLAWRGEEPYTVWIERTVDGRPAADSFPFGMPSDPPWKDTEFVVAAGDWMTARTCLPLFAERIFRTARTILSETNVAPDLVDFAKELIDGVLQINQLLTAYRKNKGGSPSEIAKELKLEDKNVLLAYLEMVGLTDADLRSAHAELGCLLMLSERYRAVADEMLKFGCLRKSHAASQEREAI